MNSNLPSYLKDKKQMEEITSNWKLLDKDDSGVQLWEFHDGVLWSQERCIKYHNQIIIVFDDCKSKSEMVTQSENAYKALTLALADGYVLYQP